MKAVCGCLLRGESLGESCAQNLIKLIEELSKLSIVPAELKCIFALLRQGPQFAQHKQLQQVSQLTVPYQVQPLNLSSLSVADAGCNCLAEFAWQQLLCTVFCH